MVFWIDIADSSAVWSSIDVSPRRWTRAWSLPDDSCEAATSPRVRPGSRASAEWLSSRITLAGSDNALGGGLAALVLDHVRPGTRTPDVYRSLRITLKGIVEEAEVFPSDDPDVAGVDGMEVADGVAGADAAGGVAGAGAEAFYDRGSTFPLNCVLNDGVPKKIVGMPILFRKIMFLYTWAMGFFIAMQFDFR